MLLQQLDPLLLFCFPSLTFIVQLIFFFMIRRQPRSTLFPYTTLFRSGRAPERFLPLDITSLLLHVMSKGKKRRSEERFSRNAETEIVCRLLLEKKNNNSDMRSIRRTVPAYP